MFCSPAETPDTLYGSTRAYPYLESINPTTAATSIVQIPDQGDGAGDYSTVNTAFDSANHAVYVTLDGAEYAYSNALKLASTLHFAKEGSQTAMPLTVYVSVSPAPA